MWAQQEQRYYNIKNRCSWEASEHLHPWAERQALEMRFEGLQACIEFFLGWHSPTVICICKLALQP